MSSIPRFRADTGNAFVYILLATVLLGALSFAISKNQDASPQSDIDDARVRSAVTSILSYEAQARNAINGMVQSGTKIDDIDFVLPNKTAFNTAPNINKLFHPNGGGLQWRALPASAVGPSQGSSLPVQGMYVGRFNNFQWTPSTAQDVVFTAHTITKDVCAALNLKITGSAAIPNIGNSRPMMVDSAISATANVDMTVSKCATCDGKPSFCVFNGGSNYDYYSILVAR